MEKMNCWEFKKCGRQPNGEKVRELGVCIAASDTTNNGKNGGKNAGRYCWRIAGTFCGGKVQGDFASKMTSCSKCEFFSMVKKEEKQNLLI